MDILPRPLTPIDIRTVWPDVREKLQDILDKSPIALDWIPEDIYASCREGRCLLLYRDGHFAVVQFVDAMQVEYPGYRTMWIFAAHGSRAEFQDLLEDFARSAGCQDIRMSSARQGWERGATGWTPLETVYRRVL